MNFGKIIADMVNSVKGLFLTYFINGIIDAAKNGLDKDSLISICRAAGATVSKALKEIPYVKNNAQKIEDTIQEIMNTAWDAFQEGLDADDEKIAAWTGEGAVAEGSQADAG